MKLSFVQAGRRVRLEAVEEKGGLLVKLAAMGLVPGEEIGVLRNSLHDPFLIEIKGAQIILDRRIAGRIEVN